MACAERLDLRFSLPERMEAAFGSALSLAEWGMEDRLLGSGMASNGRVDKAGEVDAEPAAGISVTVSVESAAGDDVAKA